MDWSPRAALSHIVHSETPSRRVKRSAGPDPSFTATLSIILALLLAGCGWQKPKPLPQERFDASRTTTIHVPPKELVKLIQKDLAAPPLELSLQSVQDGVIFTSWHEYEGAIHIARRWRERTRFRINVLPDYNDPLGTSHVDVFDETEEKPSDPQPWYPNPDLRRPERSDEVMKLIVKSAAKAK